jgi:hypothetical protein
MRFLPRSALSFLACKGSGRFPPYTIKGGGANGASSWGGSFALIVEACFILGGCFFSTLTDKSCKVLIK